MLNLKAFFTRKPEPVGINVYKPTLACGDIFPVALPHPETGQKIGCIVKVKIETNEFGSEYFHSIEGVRYRDTMVALIEAIKEGVPIGIERAEKERVDGNA